MNIRLLLFCLTILAPLMICTDQIHCQQEESLSLEQNLDSIATLIEKEQVAAAQPNNNLTEIESARRKSRNQAIAQVMHTLQFEIARQDWTLVDSKLVLIDSIGFEDPKITKLIKQTRQQISTRIEKSATRLKSYGKKILAAKKASDLDSIIESLGVTTRKTGSLSQQPPSLQFVTLWQDYLAQKEQGEEKRARELMKTLARSHPINSFGIPRSVILLKSLPERSELMIKGDASPEEVMALIKNFEDIPKVLDTLHELNNRGKLNSATKYLIPGLEQIRSDYRQYLSGANVEVDLKGSPTSGRTFLLPLQIELTKKTLPSNLGLKGKFEPTKNESVVEYLERVIDMALKDGNADLLRKAFTVRDKLRNPYSSNSQRSPDYTALKEYQSAVNYHATQQYSLAVVAYLKCLSSGSSNVPIEKIKEVLLDIEKNHAEHYASGISMSQSNGYRGISRAIIMPRRAEALPSTQESKKTPAITSPKNEKEKTSPKPGSNSRPK